MNNQRISNLNPNSKLKPLPEVINGFRVVEDLGTKLSSGKKRRFAIFECKHCSIEFERSVEHIKAPSVRGCGCKALKLKEFPDEVNGFTIVQRLDKFKGRRRIFIAVCKLCKNEYETCLDYLKDAESCSCAWQTPNVSRRLQRCYASMKQRCDPKNIKNRNYRNYIARGIKVCDEWLHNSHAFYKWALSNGYQDNLTLDRIDNDKGYSPENCRFATRAQQMRNRRVSRFNKDDVVYIRLNPEKLSQTQLAEKFNTSSGAICRIMNKTRFKDI